MCARVLCAQVKPCRSCVAYRYKAHGSLYTCSSPRGLRAKHTWHNIYKSTSPQVFYEYIVLYYLPRASICTWQDNELVRPPVIPRYDYIIHSQRLCFVTVEDLILVYYFPILRQNNYIYIVHLTLLSHRQQMLHIFVEKIVHCIFFCQYLPMKMPSIGDAVKT